MKNNLDKKFHHLFFLTLMLTFFFQIFLLVSPALAEDKCTGVGEVGSLTFCPNVSLGPNMVKGTAYPVDTQTLGKYIQIWYGLIIGTVGILASIMIMYGGFKWLTSRGGQAVSEAKDIIFSALIGLTLAFLSYTILYLVNPNLLKIGLPGNLTAIQYSGNFNVVLIQPYIDPANGNQVVTNQGFQLTSADAGPQKPGESAADALARNARASVGVSTANVPQTNGGRLACAYSVNEIARNAYGQPIGGGLSVDAMAQSLAGNSNYTVIPNANNDLSQLKPGDIIISPLVGADGGHHLITSDEHVGVYVGDGQVVSNNSGRAQIGNPYDAAGWANYYGYFDVYRPK